mmetsp:Transcript_55285/g.134282  ORF Transcript_55285/g.134282 Transcript_55285/m.134282 type:complete len:413 (+) Transcript_55285:85-1323(+)
MRQQQSASMLLRRRREVTPVVAVIVVVLVAAMSLHAGLVESLQLFRRRRSAKPPIANVAASTKTTSVVLPPVQEQTVTLDLHTNVIDDVIDANERSTTLSDERLDSDNDIDNTQNTNPGNDASTMIRFEAPFRASSRPLVVPPEFIEDDPTLLISRLTDFLSEPSHLTFGPSVSSTIVANKDLSDDVIDRWASSCRSIGACTPDPTSDRVVSIKTHGISIPGLTVEWSALLGTKVVIDAVDKNIQEKEATTEVLPSLELVLIEDECQAKGARPLVWTFQKILGRSSRKKKRQQRQSSSEDDIESDDSKSTGKGKRRRETNFITRLAFCNKVDSGTADNNNNNITLICSGTMLMKFPIPRLLQKRLFRSPEAKIKSETKMGTLISNQIEKDVYESCLLAWEENYESYFFPSRE